MPQHLGITLFFCLTLISLFASGVNGTLHAEPHHRRMLQKRVPQLIPIPGAGQSTRATQVSSSTPVSTPTGGVSTAATQVSSGTASSASDTASTSPSSTSSSTSSTRSISSDSASTSAPSPTALPNAGASTSLPLGPQTQTLTTSGASSSASTVAQQDTATTSQQKLTLTVIIVVASSIGGIAILWTVFRKWKLGRSSRFDERLQPIEWKPPSEDNHRRRPVSNASSFHSGGGGGGGHDFGSEQGHDHAQNNLAPIPDHDFTALPSNRFPAVGGYADLARGPSPQPPHMMEYSHNPGAVMGPGYDVNVPLHHQGGYGGRDAYDYTNYNNTAMRY